MHTSPGGLSFLFSINRAKILPAAARPNACCNAMGAFIAPLPLSLSEHRDFVSGPRRPSGRARDSGCVRRRPRLVARLRSTSPDEEFILPALDREILEGDAGSSTRSITPNTIAELRRAQKVVERRLGSKRGEDDDEEARRRQLAGEKLSAADLFGGVSLEAPQSSSKNGTKRTTIQVPSVKPPTRTRESTVPYRERGAQQAAEEVKRAKSLLEGSSRNFLTPGVIVSHARHGYGRFRGLERTVEKRNRGERQDTPLRKEFAVIEYRDGDVYVPLAHLDLLNVVQDDKIPDRLDSLSASMGYGVSDSSRNTRSRKSKHNARVKTRAKIRQQLVNLNELYTNRLTQKRDVFPIDFEAEERFGNSCGFQLTIDQKRATDELLNDLSKCEKPMDRLLCGDVGFGKTEVAMRAAFRVLAAGKQVAVLAPTTILAQQHYETFRDRFEKSFPDIRIACLTRFARRSVVIEERKLLSTGEMSIAIGTHMLLGDNIRFKDLGLLIVDEENRWGVNQKEKLRVRYRGVDTLVLSATPIPRTLHLALSGLKDTSVLRTPPPGRKAVITRVVPNGAGVVRNAIQTEVDRGGQVFFVVPRIEGIESAANWIRDLFPDLRVIVAHGSTSNLERKIWAFAQYEYDVLVCTTIIENGINLPRVNTMIVQDAGRFGLAQLHQLRGRVGRCNTQAYAWLLYNKTGSGERSAAEVRLATLEKNSNLGSGFVIAQKDMEMRGVGTVLGVEQHGNTSVGAEEYARMLAEELEFARTGKPIPLSIPVVDSCEICLPVASFIPTEYIGDPDLKMMAYASMSSAKSAKQLASIARMLESKFGSLPTPTKLHLSVLKVKLMAKALGISRVYSERQHVVLDWSVSPDTLKYIISSLPDKRTQDRFQHVEEEEKVFLRGLGICAGEIQLAKIREYFLFFVELGEKLKQSQPKAEDIKLENVLSRDVQHVRRGQRESLPLRHVPGKTCHKGARVAPWNIYRAEDIQPTHVKKPPHKRHLTAW